MTEDHQAGIANKMKIIMTKLKTFKTMKMLGDTITKEEGTKITDTLKGEVDAVCANIDYLVANPQVKAPGGGKAKAEFTF